MQLYYGFFSTLGKSEENIHKIRKKNLFTHSMCIFNARNINLFFLGSMHFLSDFETQF